VANKKTAKKKKTGRPTQYKSRYCQMLIRFFDIEPFTEQKVPHYDESGKKHKNGQPVVTWYETKKEPNRTPTLRAFAKKIEVSYVTVYSWLKKHEEFLNAFARAREARKWFLIENGLNGLYPPNTFKYVANNETDMKDTSKHELTGEDGGPIKAKVEVVHFAKANTDNDDGGSPDTD